MSLPPSNLEAHLGLRVAYHGSSFFGFQSQPNGKAVQDVIERSLSIYFGRPLKVEFTSRTDTGVHAMDQWVIVRNQSHLFEELSLTKQKLFMRSLNVLMNGEVCVWQVLRLHPDFHPKKTVESKTYEYQILQGPVEDPLSLDRMWWIRDDLDLEEIRNALKVLVGTHDFKSFANSRRGGEEPRSTIRSLYEAHISAHAHRHIQGLQVFCLRFRGNGFLYRMVRNMVGVLVEVGRKENISINELLSQKRRDSRLAAAPAHGLCLVKTDVKKELFEVLAPRHQEECSLYCKNLA